MSQDRRLRPEEREFFGLLAETVYANPFGSDQERLRRLVGKAIDLKKKILENGPFLCFDKKRWTFV